MTTIKEQQELFTILGWSLKKKLECYLIGGSAMLDYGAKDVTKDIDIVFIDEKGREMAVEALKALGFKERETKLLYVDKKNTPVLLQRADDRFDLFNEKIIDFRFTESMAERVHSIYEYNNLIAKIVSPEDIILLKCATERAGDRIDAAKLIRQFNIKWDTIIEESALQMKLIGDVIPLELYNFFSELKEDLGIDIPKRVMEKLRLMSEKALEEKLKKGHIKVTKYKGGHHS